MENVENWLGLPNVLIEMFPVLALPIIMVGSASVVLGSALVLRFILDRI